MSEKLLYTTSLPFEAARSVKILPRSHRSHNLHGHSFLANIRAKLPRGWNSFPGGESEALMSHLSEVLKEIDYSRLNDSIEIPTDENISRYIFEKLGLPELDVVGVQSTRDQGADITINGDAHIWRRYRFEAAHQLPNVPEGHQCGRMHGHGFEVILHLSQSIDSLDMGFDYEDIDRCWAEVNNELHYSCLNDIPGLENPTSEMLSQWLWLRLKPILPLLSWVTVYETVTAGCHFNGIKYRIWKEQRFESALQLINAPSGDPRRRLHGHSYTVRLHLSADLDPVLGWTVDYGDVKQIFKPIYKMLDHQNLNHSLSMESADVGSVAKWIYNQVKNDLEYLDRIDLIQSPEQGAIYMNGNQKLHLPSGV